MAAQTATLNQITVSERRRCFQRRREGQCELRSFSPLSAGMIPSGRALKAVA